MSEPGKKPRICRSERGQSTVEFALTMILLVGFILFFFQTSLMMGFASYAQYATFMAARAYLSAGTNVADQQDRATKVLSQMLKQANNQGIDRFPFIAKGVSGSGGGNSPVQGMSFDDTDHLDPTKRDSSWPLGVRYSFKGKIFIMPIGTGDPAAKNPSATSLSLTSETYLGREPTADECSSKEMPLRGKGIWDNGC